MSVKTEDFLSDEFLKQFKRGEQLNQFLGSMQKRAIEKMLEGEIDDPISFMKNMGKDKRSTTSTGFVKK